MRFIKLTFSLAAFAAGVLSLTGNAGADGSEVQAEDDASISWVTHLGNRNPDLLYTLDVVPDGAVTIGGVFAGTLELGGAQLHSQARSQDGFIARLRPDGSVAWARGFGGDRQDTLNGLGLAPDGTVFATGQYSGSARFDGEGDVEALEPNGLSDMFLVKIDEDGGPLWARTLGGEYGDVGRVLVAAPDGGLFLAGQFQLTAEFGAGEGEESALESRGSTDVALLRADTDGGVRWLHQLGGEGQDTVADAVSDGSGGLVVTGTFDEQATFGKTSFSGAGRGDLYLLRVAADGDTRWARAFGNAKSDNPGKLATDGDGNIVFGGSLQGAWSLDEMTLESAGGTDTVVISWSPDGELQWARRYGGVNSETTEAVAIGPDGRIYLAASFSDATEIGDHKLESVDTDAFLLVLEPNGEVADVHHFPVRGIERILALKALDTGEIVVGGIFQNELRIGATMLKSRGKSDIFVARMRLP